MWAGLIRMPVMVSACKEQAKARVSYIKAALANGLRISFYLHIMLWVAYIHSIILGYAYNKPKDSQWIWHA